MRKVAFAIGVAVASLPLTVSAQAPDRSHYPDTEKGLRRLVEDLHSAALADDSAAFEALVQPLVLRDPSVWFIDVFGENLGAYAASDYRSRTGAFVRVFLNSFQNLQADGYDVLEVDRFAEPCSVGVLDNEYPILLSRQKKVQMYVVRYRKDRRSRSFGFFAHADGGFRYLGHVGLPPAPKVKPHDEIREDVRKGRAVVVGGSVQQAKLLSRPAPTYPGQARAAGIQGTVRLMATIGKDGKVKDLQFVSGHCWLGEAAIEAVGKWRYSPTLLEGHPVDVATTIDVVFTLRP